MPKVSKVGDLKVYRRLVDLHLRVHKLSLTFPKFEIYELGPQVRRSSNSAPANLPAVWCGTCSQVDSPQPPLPTTLK